MEQKMRAKGKKHGKKRLISKEHRFMFLHQIPFFGIEHPSIDEAAELIVLDRAFNGCYPKEVPKNLKDDSHIPILLKKLSKEIEKFKTRLVSAVEDGVLKAEPVRFDLDGKPITELFNFNANDIIKWLQDRGYVVGDFFLKYCVKESQIMNHVCDEIIYMRTVDDSDLELKDIENDSKLKDPIIAKLVRYYRSKLAKHVVSSVHKKSTTDTELGTRSRNTMLTLIAALCKMADLDFAERGLAKKISIQTSQLGATIDDATIRKIFLDIQDAVDARSKDKWERH